MLRAVTAAAIAGLIAASSAAQQTSPTPPAAKESIKANARPTPTPSAGMPEPFDKADVALMSGQCVTFDTEAGQIMLEVFPESAPETVRNFLNLVAIGAYNTTLFNRVVPGFVVQGGNIWTREGGVPRELGARARRTVPDEPNKILHERGIVSMARSDQPNSATTDFFFVIDRAAHLDGTFAAFGRVIGGMEVVEAMNKANVTDEKPEKPVRLRKAAVAPCAAR